MDPGIELPRIHVQDLDQYKHFLERRDPFILLGAADWPIVEDAKDMAGHGWKNLVKRWPKAVTDFYPHNMLSHSRPLSHSVINSGRGAESRSKDAGVEV